MLIRFLCIPHIFMGRLIQIPEKQKIMNHKVRINYI